jgi:CRP-like cAMP-binding protein
MNRHYEDYLLEIPLFQGCTRKELKRIASLAERVAAAPGRVLVTEGARTKEFFVLRSGTAVVTRDGVELATLRGGDHFGELALLDPAPRNATVTMTSAGEVICLPQREFWTLVHELPPLRHLLLSSLAQRVHTLDRPATAAAQ